MSERHLPSSPSRRRADPADANEGDQLLEELRQSFDPEEPANPNTFEPQGKSASRNWQDGALRRDSRPRHRVLIVDDDPGILAIAKHALETAKYDVITLDRGGSVLAKCRDTPLDAIVLDIMMPETSGLDLVKEIRNSGPNRDVPILLLSALSTVEDRVRGLRQGADDYLVKPFEPSELVARVGALAARKERAHIGLQGSLESNPITEIVQGLDQNRKSGVIEIETNQALGRIALSCGQLKSAEFLHLVGSEAFLAMIACRKGYFRFTPAATEKATPQSSESVQALILEAMWVEDELQIRHQWQPARDTGLTLTTISPSLDARFDRLPVAEILALLLQTPGMTPASLEQTVASSPKKVELAVALLVESGAAIMRPKRASAIPREAS